jgi:hypothetical protein
VTEFRTLTCHLLGGDWGKSRGTLYSIIHVLQSHVRKRGSVLCPSFCAYTRFFKPYNHNTNFDCCINLKSGTVYLNGTCIIVRAIFTACGNSSYSEIFQKKIVLHTFSGIRHLFANIPICSYGIGRCTAYEKQWDCGAITGLVYNISSDSNTAGCFCTTSCF